MSTTAAFLDFAALCVEIDAANKPHRSGPIAILAQRYRNGLAGPAIEQLKDLAEAVNGGQGETPMLLDSYQGKFSVMFTAGILTARVDFTFSTNAAEVSVGAPRALDDRVRFNK